VPSRADLERFFFLDDADRGLIGDRRGDHNRLGFVLQATTVRYIGVFLADPLDVPWPVVEYLAEQLGIPDPSCVKRYVERPKKAYEHAWEIRDAYGFRAFEEEMVAGEFRRFLDGREWTHPEGPAALFDHGVGWLRRHRVLLPGITVLTRLVNTVRPAAAERMHAVLAAAAVEADPMLPGRLRGSLEVPPGARFSELEQWRRTPTRVSGPGLVRALDRAGDLAGLGARAVDCSAVPPNRMASLARHGLASKAAALAGLAEPRRTATLLAMARHLDAAASDDALDLFALLMATRLISPARAASNAERLSWLPRLERASRTLARVNRELVVTLLDAAAEIAVRLDVAAAWAEVEKVASREQVAGAVAVVEELVPDDDGSADVAMRSALADRYRTVRPFLAMLGESSALAAASGAAVLAAVRTLPVLAARKVKARPLQPGEIDTALVPPVWHRAVYGNPQLPAGAVDRDAYVVCVLEQLHKALRVRDVFAVPSHRWGDPRAQLLSGQSWEAVRPQVLDGVGLAGPVEAHLGGLTGELDAAWRQMADPAGRGRGRGRRAGGPRRRWPDAAVGRAAGGLGRAGQPGDAAGADRGDAAPGRPAGPADGGPRLDRLPRRLHPRLRRRGPDERPDHLGRRAAGRRGVNRHRRGVLLRHGVRRLPAAGLPVLTTDRRHRRHPVLAGALAGRSGLRLRAAERDRPEQGQPGQDRPVLAGHAPGLRVTGHRPGQRLRRAADARTRRPPHTAGPGLPGLRPDRQDPAPAGDGRPGRRHPPPHRQPPRPP
jgi:hypothetical protein